MASSEIRNDGSATRTEDPVATHEELAPSATPTSTSERSRRRPAGRVIASAERDRMIKEARDIDFPIGLRGYERAAVDRYVERVNRIMAELEMSASPESAIRHALDEVSEETRDILQRAHQTADDIESRSRARADERLEQAEQEAEQRLDGARQAAEDARLAAQNAAQDIRGAAQREAQELRDTAKGEAQEVREAAQRAASELREATMQEMTELRETAVRESQELRTAAQREADELLADARRRTRETLERAEAEARELGRSAEVIWRERRRLIDDMREVGGQLVAIGEVEAKRFPHLAEELPSGDAAGERASEVPAAAPQEAEQA